MGNDIIIMSFSMSIVSKDGPILLLFHSFFFPEILLLLTYYSQQYVLLKNIYFAEY